jgi:hypothetical protein
MTTNEITQDQWELIKASLARFFETLAETLREVFRLIAYPIRVMISHQQDIQKLKKILDDAIKPEGVAKRMAIDLEAAEDALNNLWELSGPHDHEWENPQEVYWHLVGRVKKAPKKKGGKKC